MPKNSKKSNAFTPTEAPNAGGLGYKSSSVAEMGDRLATIDMVRKAGAAMPLSAGRDGSASNTMPGPRPTIPP